MSNDTWGERGYTTTYVQPDSATDIRARDDGRNDVVIVIGSVTILVADEATLDRLEQAINDARPTLASRLAAAVSA